MNIPYLKNHIIPQRTKELKEGKNLGTADPIYVVLDLGYMFFSGHDIDGFISGDLLNYKRKEAEFGYVDAALDSEDREFLESKENMTNPIEVTKIYYDQFVAFFLTSEAAHQYLQYQSHNLREAYVYVFNAGYRNHEMRSLLTESKKSDQKYKTDPCL